MRKPLVHSGKGLSLKARTGPATVPRARRVAAMLDQLCDALFAVCQERVTMLDLESVANDLSEVEMSFLLIRMRSAFHETVDEPLENRYADPLKESATINRTITQFSE